MSRVYWNDEKVSIEELSRIFELAEEILCHIQNIKKVQNSKKNYSLLMFVLSYLSFIFPILLSSNFGSSYSFYIPVVITISIGLIFLYFSINSWKDYKSLKTDLKVQEDILAELIQHLYQTIRFIKIEEKLPVLDMLIFETKLKMLHFKVMG